jgi:outer membrane receptor for ferrienterochelin and colicin
LLPVPDAPFVMAIQVALLTAVQLAVAEAAERAMLPVPAAAPTVTAAGFSEKLGAAAACVTVNVRPEMVIVPIRAVAEVLAVTE